MIQGVGFNGTFALNEKHGTLGEFSASHGYQNPLFLLSDQKRDGFVGFDGLEADNKRIRLMGSNKQLIDAPLNLLEVSSPPLGLRLRKTASFLNLIEMKLSWGLKASPIQTAESSNSDRLKTSPIEVVTNIDSEKLTGRFSVVASQPISEKLKASNFSANLLRIGSWERVSQYEGDLVAKCYYAKRKLVWEVLDSGLKSKIEIQWSNISAIRATFQKNAPGILEVELNNPPLFFLETNPQPRKHTLWQATSDFTGGQAPIFRKHYLQFPEGTLERHYEKLLKCDDRLNALRQRPFPTLSSPYFSSYGTCQGPIYDLSSHGLDSGFNCTSEGNYLSQLSHSDMERPPAVPSLQLPDFEFHRQAVDLNNSTSPSSVIDFPHFQGNGARQQVERQKNLFPSEAYKIQDDVVSRDTDRIEGIPVIASADQNTPSLHQLISPADDQEILTANNWELNKIAEHLINYPLSSTCDDEQKTLSEVNSIHSLLDIPMHLQSRDENIDDGYKQYHCQMMRTINDSLISRNLNRLHDCRELVNSTIQLTVQDSSQTLSRQVPPITSYPCFISNHAPEGFSHEDPYTAWNH